jgi:hypothetical protein
MKPVLLIVGLVCVALGGLWLLQGLGIVHIRPILCFADCEVVQGPSPGWAVIGLLAVMAGAIAILFSLKRGIRRAD